MAIIERLNQLSEIKNDIKAAINNKGGSVGDDMTAYAQAITNLPGGISSYLNGNWNKVTTVADSSILDAGNSSASVVAQVYVLANASDATMNVYVQGCDESTFANPVNIRTFTYTGASAYNTGVTYTATVSGYKYYRVEKGSTSAYANHCNYFLICI